VMADDDLTFFGYHEGARQKPLKNALSRDDIAQLLRVGCVMAEDAGC
jgi:hypothetical protein